MADALCERARAVRARVDEAARAAGRDPAAVALVAVGKTRPAAEIAALHAAGFRDFGENYAQELRAKGLELAGALGLRWHFIGTLQRNKAKYVVGLAELIHTVDGELLLLELEKLAARRGVVQRCLVEVNVAGEARKGGVAPDGLGALLDAFAKTPHVRCEGLMTMPPFEVDPRPHFRALRGLAERERGKARPNVELRELSMGMTSDFEIAVAEGATIVRVGTAIFGERARKA